jgi:hypothetical protein
LCADKSAFSISTLEIESRKYPKKILLLKWIQDWI